MPERLFPEWRLVPSGEGFIYYEGPLSRGVRVSNFEAEVYLAGDEGDWYEIIGDRVRTEPVRPFWPGLVARLGSMPAGFVFLTGFAGAVLLSHAIAGSDVTWRAIQGGLSLAMIALSLVGLWGSHR